MTSQNASLTNMITQQLRTGDVLNEGILALYDDLHRHAFVPPHMQAFAYSDMQIPLSHEQRMLTPLEEGSILQALRLRGDETVLEIGTGTGFLTALLSRLCNKVISVDFYEGFGQSAAALLRQYHCDNVELITGDGSQGWLDKAPYDVIVMTGAIEKVTETLRLQILPGGKLFTIVGKQPALQAMLLSLDHHDNWTETMLFETSIPPLINSIKADGFIF